LCVVEVSVVEGVGWGRLERKFWKGAGGRVLFKEGFEVKVCVMEKVVRDFGEVR
jgi:hypothetical protein